MEHYHDVIAFLGVFFIAFILVFICEQLEKITKTKKKYMYGNAKSGDCLKPKG